MTQTSRSLNTLEQSHQRAPHAPIRPRKLLPIMNFDVLKNCRPMTPASIAMWASSMAANNEEG